MGLLSRVRTALVRFVNRTRSGWGRWVGPRSRRELEVGDGAGNSIVQSAVGWIARNFPEARVRVREKIGTELQETLDAGVESFLDLLEAPNGWYSGVLLWMGTIADYWLSGNAYWLKVRGEAGRVVALWWIPSYVIGPKWDDKAGADFISHYLYKPTAIDEYEIKPTEVVHFRFGFDPDNPRIGRSPITTVLREVMTDEEAAAYTAAILRNQGVPGIVISPDDETTEIEQTDADAMKEEFLANFGNERRGEPMIISTKARVEKLSFNPQEMDLRTIRRIPEERISGVIGVPAIVAGLGAGLDRSTFANYGEAREAGYEENIIPTQRILSADLRIQLLVDFVDEVRRFVVDFDVTEVRVLQEDQNRIWERAGNAVAKGITTIADFNRAVGLPVDDKLHDVYLRDARIVAIRRDAPEAIGEAPEEEPAPAGSPDGVSPELEDTIPVEPAARGNTNGNGSTEPVGAAGGNA